MYAPKAISLISRFPNFKLQKSFLKFIKSTLILPKRFNYSNQLSIPKCLIADFNQLTKIYPEAQAEEILDSKYEVMKSFYSKEELESDVKIVNEQDFFEFYISCLFSLFSITERTNDCAFIKPDIKKKESFLLLRSVAESNMSLPLFSFKPLIQKLSLDNITKIYKAILLEKQIIFFRVIPRKFPLCARVSYL